MPLVSVGIPCFNRPEGLERLLGLIIQQTFRDIEILISDDCSTNPEVGRVAGRYADADPRIRFFRQPKNIGALPNHQFLKDIARGKYFMWAHDDDEFPTNYIEVCLRHFELAPDVVLVGPSCDRYFDGKYLSTYDNFCSIGHSAYRRLHDLMPDAFKYRSRFEHYWSGLCLLEAAPRRISEEPQTDFNYFFLLSEKGAIAHASELRLIKHTTQDNYDRYGNDPFYRRHAILRYFGKGMQECIPITFQILSAIWKSHRLTLREKSSLTGRCLALFAKHPMLFEITSRAPRPIIHFVRTRLFFFRGQQDEGAQ